MNLHLFRELTFTHLFCVHICLTSTITIVFYIIELEIKAGTSTNPKNEQKYISKVILFIIHVRKTFQRFPKPE